MFDNIDNILTKYSVYYILYIQRGDKKMTEEEFEKIMEYNRKHAKDKFCPKCDEVQKTARATCGVCGTKLLEDWKNVPRCPVCNSSNIQKISGASRITHGLAFGLFSKTARSQFKCNHCGNKW